MIGHRPGVLPAPNEPTPDQATTTLYLVDPAGGRYPITAFPTGSTPRLVDWSGDGSHALFQLVKPGYVSGGTVISVDLNNGKQTTFPIVKDGGPIGYARPDGTAVLIGKGQDGGQPSLERVDLAGNQERTYPVGPRVAPEGRFRHPMARRWSSARPPALRSWATTGRPARCCRSRGRSPRAHRSGGGPQQ